MSQTAIQATLDAYYSDACGQWQTYLGYPNNPTPMDADLFRFLDLPLRNVGDPFKQNNCIHTCRFERELLEFLADLYHLERDRMHGYATSGGTEGNIFGLYLGRESLPGARLYCSAASHYSVFKAARLLGLPGCTIPVDASGEMDYDVLARELYLGRSRPAIIVANIGTTMTGAVDQVARIQAVAREVGQRRLHLHCDAALSGLLLPFLPSAPLFDFRLKIDSLAVSTHKLLGGPIPCGVVLYRAAEAQTLCGDIAYLAADDTTLLGSRDAFSVLVIWKKLQKLGLEGLRAQAERAMSLTAYAREALERIAWPVWANPNANTLVIASPGVEIERTWHLAHQNGQAHLVLMPCVTHEKIDAFVAALSARLP